MKILGDLHSRGGHSHGCIGGGKDTVTDRVGVQASDPDLLGTPRPSRILERLAQQGKL